MTPWRRGYLLCYEVDFPCIFGLNEYDSTMLKRRLIELVDDAIIKAGRM